MKISIETTTNLGRRLTISVPSETFEDRISARLIDAAKQVRLPGFRAGKVPMKEVRRRYGRSVRTEVASELMQSSFVEAIGQESLSPAGAPKLDVVKMDPGIDLEFTATFEVFPNVTLGDFGKVSVKRPEADITDADLDAMIEKLRQQRATMEPVDRAAAEGDQAKVDFNGTKDGAPFAGGDGEDVTFMLGQGQMIADFDTNCVGLAAGESTQFEAVFPEDYQAEEMQGATVTFSVTMKEVAQQKVPELDGDFFKEFGVEDGTLESFRTEVRSNMARELDSAVKNQLKTQVLDELQGLHDLQLPESLITQEIGALKQKMMQQLQMYGSNQAMPELDDALFRDEAEKRVAVGLVLNEIINVHEIEAEADRVRERIDSIAQPYADPAQVVNYYYGNPEQLQQIEMAVIEDQVIDRVLESAKIESVSASYDAVLAGTAIAPPETSSDDSTDEQSSASGASE